MTGCYEKSQVGSLLEDEGWGRIRPMCLAGLPEGR